MTRRRAVLVVVVGFAVAAGLVAAAAGTSSPPEAAGPGAAEPPPASDTTDTTDVVVGDADPTCERVQAELDRRDEAGTVDWETIEGSDEEPTEAELESVTIEHDPVPGDVAAGEERPTFPDFPDGLDVATLSDEALVETVDICYEVGALTDDEAG